MIDPKSEPAGSILPERLLNLLRNSLVPFWEDVMVEDQAKEVKPYGAPKLWEGYGFPFFFFGAFFAISVLLLVLSRLLHS
ncbi:MULTISPECIES: hypothetical protein [Achromobacter]|uniref:hypothetical protein n=1 Tax=Achromobacter TaxID=222 RepID=UPI002FE27FCA